jgi:hypothetical protein
MLLAIRAISLVLFRQVASVRAIFAVIPIMVVVMVPIVDSNLNAGVLWPCGGHDRHGRHKGSSQEQGTDVTVCSVHVSVLRIATSDFGIAADITMHRQPIDRCPVWHIPIE